MSTQQSINADLCTIQERHRILINTDPQRRCYNGCHYKSELIWSEWVDFEYEIPLITADHRLEWWRDLNDYAVQSRGEGARREFRVIPSKVV